MHHSELLFSSCKTIYRNFQSTLDQCCEMWFISVFVSLWMGHWVTKKFVQWTREFKISVGGITEKPITSPVFKKPHVPHTEEKYLIYVCYVKCHKLENLKWLMISLIISCEISWIISNFVFKEVSHKNKMTFFSLYRDMQ